MRLLIDGYNVMHAAGRMNRRFGPDGLRKARDRFLNDLAHVLGVEQAGRTTIVFDANSLPVNQAPESAHKGMSVIYAIEDDDADSRIERLIAADSAPRSLTVVSTDRRIRRAAERRRASPLPADDFLDYLDSLRSRTDGRSLESAQQGDRTRSDRPSPEEVDSWVRVFSDLEDDPDLDDAFGPGPAQWTDADLERVAREVEAEFRDLVRPIPRRARRR